MRWYPIIIPGGMGCVLLYNLNHGCDLIYSKLNLFSGLVFNIPFKKLLPSYETNDGIW